MGTGLPTAIIVLVDLDVMEPGAGESKAPK